MSRPLRFETAGGFYHVFNRGLSGRPVFECDTDRRRFLALAREVCDRFGVRIHCFCLMGNHYHLLLETPQPNLSATMKHLGSVYTQKFNRTHARDGALFKGRFSSIFIERETYLLRLVGYIHRNPVTAGLVQSAGEYEWSSHAVFMGRSPKPHFLTTELVWSMLGGSARERRKAMQRLADEPTPPKLVERIEGARRAAILGSDAFLIRHGVKPVAQDSTALPDALRIRLDVGWNRILEAVCAEFSVTRDELLERQGKSRPARKALVILLREDLSMSVSEIGRRIAYSPTGVQSIVRRALVAGEADPLLQNRLDAIRRKLLA
jgi:putative transposase